MTAWRFILMAALSVLIAPLAQAVAKIDAKTPIGAALRSDQWADVPLALRERAQFSANVTSVKLLQAIQDKLQKRIGLVREQVAHGDALVDRSSFIADIRAIAVAEGVQTAGKGGAGTIRDIRSSARLGLIFDQQTRSAAGFADWKMGQDAAVLDAFPAQELVRLEERQVPRNWTSRWLAAGGPMSGSRMIALKTDPIWAKISRFDTPWPPFDYGSGMGVADVSRGEAESLGLLQPAVTVTPIEADFNAGLQASVQDLPKEQRKALHDAFGDQVKLYGDTIKWLPDAVQGFVQKVTTERHLELNAFSIGRATSATVAKSPSVDFADTALKLPTSEARHIWDTHGPESKPTPDSIPMTPAEFRSLPVMWRSPDQVTFDGEPETAVFWKRLPDGNWTRMVVQKTGTKSAKIVTANKRERGPREDAGNPDAVRPQGQRPERNPGLA